MSARRALMRTGARIQDRDQIVVQSGDVQLPPGHSEYQSPYARYAFQRTDHCFMVVVDVERIPYPVDAARELCANPLGWTLRP